MSFFNPHFPAFLLRTVFLIVLFASTFAGTSVATAADKVDFKDFKIQGKTPQYHVLTRVDYKLTDYLSKALLNGVTLNAHVQFRLGQHRSWWFNKDKPLLTVQYQLKYHALSRRYLLTRKDTNEHWNFNSLAGTLRKLGELRKYKLPPLPQIKEGEDYYILAVADMVPATLKLPLRLQSLFSDEFSISSEGVFWPLP